MIKALYFVPYIFSDTNGGDYGVVFSDTPSTEIIDEYFKSSFYHYSFEGTYGPNGEYNDDEYFCDAWRDVTEAIEFVTDDPEEIETLMYNSSIYILGHETLCKYPKTPPVQGCEAPRTDLEEGDIPF